jgi:predicted DNA-binding transcriptional regulator YafY
MSEVSRLYSYRSLFARRRVVSSQDLMVELEISPATLKRDLAKLRDQLHVPIKYDRDRGGYYMEQGHTDTELPGLWFSPEEVLALLTIDEMLTQLEPGLLGPKLKPLQQRLMSLLEKQGTSAEQLGKRIRLLHAGKRRVVLKNFEAVATATMGRQQIRINHFNRQNGDRLERTVSPQQLVYYRDNWYLDAWCHTRNGLDTPAIDVAPDQLRQAASTNYGIFSGPTKGRATLRFSPERARWVSREIWHPEQHSHTDAQGHYVLEIPYADERELLGDILRFGADVEVVEPPDLRNRVKRALHEAAGRYV